MRDEQLDLPAEFGREGGGVQTVGMFGDPLAGDEGPARVAGAGQCRSDQRGVGFVVGPSYAVLSSRAALGFGR